MHYKDETVYLSKVKNDLEMQTDSSSLVALKYGRHRKAYHMALEDQKYLKQGGLEVKILARAFREFSNLKEVTIEDSNDTIGSRELIRDFGAFKAGDLLTCNGVNTVATLIHALSEAGVQLSDLTIKSQYDIFREQHCNKLDNESILNIHSAGGPQRSYPEGLCSNAMSITFCDSENLTHARRVLQQLRTLDIEELVVEENSSDLAKMANAVRSLIAISQKLETLKVMEISSHSFSSDPELLSIEDLFCLPEPRELCSLKTVSLYGLAIKNRQTLVTFIELHARSLQEVSFHCCRIMNLK